MPVVSDSEYHSKVGVLVLFVVFRLNDTTPFAEEDRDMGRFRDCPEEQSADLVADFDWLRLLPFPQEVVQHEAIGMPSRST